MAPFDKGLFLTSLVTLALLGAGDRALSLDETARAVQSLCHYVRRRKLPTTENPELDTPDGIARVLAGLIENGIVTSYAGGPETVYAIGQEQHLAAAYYRNTVIHFFVNAAIVELARRSVEAPKRLVPRALDSSCGPPRATAPSPTRSSRAAFISSTA